MVAVLDALGLEQAHVIGMSMGGFVAVELAVRFPGRVKSLVLVDGGFPMVPPPGLTPDNVGAAFADRVARLEKAWTPEELAGFFTTTTAPLLDPDDPLLQHYLELDLDRDGRVRLSGAALVSDAASVFFGDSRWRELALPVRFGYAEWSAGADSAPAYPQERVDDYASVCTTVRRAEGVDHAAIIMSKAGAGVIADLVAEALEGGRR
jgi:pimeloyl-ACP methyl ester carboxylesterase